METTLLALTGAEHRRRPKKMTLKGPDVSFRCPVCDKTFASEKYVRMHLGIHRQVAADMQETQQDFAAGGHGDTAGHTGVWECAVCGKYFHQASYYRNHMRTHSEERPFVCDLCSIGFKERYHLKKHHLFKHSKEMNEQCRKCGKRFKDSTAVRAHERIHSDAQPFACNRCGKAFKTSECLWHHDHRSKACTAPVQHQRRDRSTCGSQAERRRSPGVTQAEIGVSELSRLLQVSSSRLNARINFRCQSQDQTITRGKNVGFRFSSSSLSSSTSNESYELRTSTEEGRKSDGNSEVNLEEVMTEWGFSASSSTSDYSAFDEAGKTSPSTAFHSSSSSSCAIANRWLEKTSSEEQRKRIAGRIACARCGKHFASSRAFEKHARLHNELRPHRCPVCDVGFKLKVHLKKHNLYRHNADYPCKCSVCGKGFKDTSAVRLHERIHSDERPFLCPCGKAFKTRENLWGHRHRLKHNTERHTTDDSNANGTPSEQQKSSPHKTNRSPSETQSELTQSQKSSFNYRDSGNDKTACDYHGRDVARDIVKTETTRDCVSLVENSNHVDCYGKTSRCDVEREEMKVLPELLMTKTSVNGHDDHLFMTSDSLRSSDEHRWWPGSRDVVGNSLPSFETLISALRSCVGNWQETGALSPLPSNGGTADLTHDRKLLGTKATRQPAICAATPEVIVETTRKGVCGRRALIQRFMQSQELCLHGTADYVVPHRSSHSLDMESDQETKCCNNILSVTWQHFQQLE